MDWSRVRTARPLAKLREGRTDWYEIKNLGSGLSEVSIYDEIGYWGVTANDFINDLGACHADTITLRLNSPGGEVFDGMAIYNALNNHPATIDVRIDGLAASIASVIAMAGDTVTMAATAQMMIHDGFAMCSGPADEMRAYADMLDKTSDTIAAVYAARTGTEPGPWRDAMRKETWYTAEEAVAAGLADKVTPLKGKTRNAVRNTWDLSIFRNTPQPVLDAADGGYQPEPYKREDWENVQCPSCDKYNDDDATYCGQCGVKLAGRDDVHEPDGPGGDEPEPGDSSRNQAPVILAAAVDDSPWDAGVAWHNGATSDNPAAFYKGICAGRKTGDPAKQTSWALPYRYHPDDPPNAAAVRNALARLPQTEGLTNEAEATSKLEALMKQIGPENKPSDSAVMELAAANLREVFA